MAGRPAEVSGGQRQRAAIARAMVLEPRLLVCDEPVSALDASNRVQVLELLQPCGAVQGIAKLFISHDLGAVRGITDRAAVLYRGRIVESGPTERVLTRGPEHPYTRLLLGSAPTLGRHRAEPRRARRAARAARDDADVTRSAAPDRPTPNPHEGSEHP